MKDIFNSLENIFELIDEDNDGYINIKDLKIFFLKLGVELTEKECEDMIKFADKNNLGKLNFKDFENQMNID